jgi:hypothetical protein
MFIHKINALCSQGFFICREVQGVWYLRFGNFLENTAEECFSPQWQGYFGYGVGFSILYPIGIPLVFAVLMYRNRHKLTSFSARQKYGFLFDAYSLDSWWFEVLDMLHKLALTAGINFIESRWQPAAGCIVAMLYLVAVLFKKPYIRQSDDLFHLFVQVEIIQLFILLALLQTMDVAQYDPVTEALLSVLLIGLSVFVFVVLVAMSCKGILLAQRKLYRRCCRRVKKGKTDIKMKPKVSSLSITPIDKQFSSGTVGSSNLRLYTNLTSKDLGAVVSK